jgi:hypothetical protein
MDDQGCQDEGHAGDRDEMPRVLRAHGRMTGVGPRAEPERDVDDAADHHQRQADACHQGRPGDSSQAVYHQHAL